MPEAERWRVAELFCPVGENVHGPVWRVPQASVWRDADPRWIDWLAEQRAHPTAREALRWAPPERVREALARFRPPAPVAREEPLSEWDWDTARALPAVAGALREQALEQARQALRPLAECFDQVAARLSSANWRALGGALRTPFGPADEPLLERLEALVGPLPPVLRAMWEVIGGVDFVWDYGVRPTPYEERIDPLSLLPARDAAGDLEQWLEEREQVCDPELAGPLFLALAPDFYHKADISGGPPYGVTLPFAGADPPFENERHDLTLLQYLELAARWQGFPGLAEHPDENLSRVLFGE